MGMVVTCPHGLLQLACLKTSALWLFGGIWWCWVWEEVPRATLVVIWALRYYDTIVFFSSLLFSSSSSSLSSSYVRRCRALSYSFANNMPSVITRSCLPTAAPFLLRVPF